MFIIGIASPYVLACHMFMKMHTVHVLYMPTEWMGKLYQRLEAASVVVPWTAIINYDIISVLVAWQPASAGISHQLYDIIIKYWKIHINIINIVVRLGGY